MKDEEVISAIKKRDEKAIAFVMQKYSGLLWKTAGAVFANTASAQDVEECVADAFIYLWQNPEKYDPDKGKLVSWLAIVARSRAIDRYRQIMRKQETSLEEDFPVKGFDLLAGVMAREEKDRLFSCMEKLPNEEREVILRRYYHEQKPKEIAMALGMPKKQVENKLYLAKQRLREMLKEAE